MKHTGRPSPAQSGAGDGGEHAYQLFWAVHDRGPPGALSAGCVGTARAALTAALQHVHEQEVVQQALARAGAVAYGMAALVRTAAAAEHDWALLSRLTTSAKVFCSEHPFELADLALQLHGGSGYIEDTGIAVLMRDARVTRIFEGANDVLLTHAGLLELTQPAAAPADPALSPLEGLFP